MEMLTEGESSLAASGAVKGPGDAGYPGTFPVLNKTNYSSVGDAYGTALEAHSLWDAIESKTIARKKDRQALSKQWDLLRSTKETQVSSAEREEQGPVSHEIEKTKGGNPRSRGRGRGHGVAEEEEGAMERLG
ncbi:unnamed protein product [Spirodela intermedia]|uniref:Uncharacterized protein n=1 Tax=Spirodela intermedia TaxID=51605 RepID=A0ABN7EDD9_SPIIN|nr:unnamed protein product [Spirodela intermedia]